ncbi:MAG TPA: molybdopterin-dependent oxidoreductase [Dehalococcoidia bacterium]|nr:molybdopterin-dependent oxidoreductase [Dehalococcoidia bacterium]
MTNPNEKKIPTFCSLCGPTMGCGIYCYVKDGRLVRVEGMEESPRNSGKLCPRAFASAQWLYSPQRLKYPLKRIGEKGEGKFEKISWDEALDIIAAKLLDQKEKYGPESLAILSPARRSYSDYLYRFLVVHGSPNYGHSGICAVQRAFGFAYTLGVSMLAPDYNNADCIIIWGGNPVYSGTPQGGLERILNAKDRGTKLVVIKPQMQPDAAKADIWMPVRPGTDGALALSMLNVVINETLYDREFVNKWCYGFDKLVPHIQKYTPEWGETITGLSAEQIREVARLYANTKAACIYAGNAFDQAVSSNNAVRAVAILIAITGHLDRPGCNLAPTFNPNMPRVKSVHLRERYTQEIVDKLVGPEIPTCFQPFIEGTSSAYYRCLDSILTEKPYPVKAIIAPGTQPTIITRGTRRVIEALEKLEFFVVVDVMQNASMPWADIVIPVATMYESDHPFEGGMGNWLMARNQVVERMGDYKSDYEFWLDLGVKMGYGDDFWNGSIEDCMNNQLENFGITMEELRKHPTGIVYEGVKSKYEKYEMMFSTPSPRLSRAPYLPQGKVAIYNTTFEENGYNPLPEWVEPPESPTATPELLEKYPLVLSDTHTSEVYNAGWLRNIPYLREIQPDPWLHINPKTAKEREIEDGDWVIVESPHGSMKVRAQYFPGISPDVVMSLQGWWQGCDELGKQGYSLVDGAGTNGLYSIDPEKAFDPLVTAMPKQTLVEVRKADTTPKRGRG